MRYEFHPEAISEYETAVEYYAERDPALAARFVAAINETLGRIVESPYRWRVIEDDVHRCLAHVFPFGVLYTIEVDYILILAVMHGSREPGYWKSRGPIP